MTPLDRRRFLGSSLLAGGGLPLNRLLATAAELGNAQGLAPPRTQHKPQARHLIVLFLTGGFSHVDTFDPKPR
jgi:hypothetical protein